MVVSLVTPPPLVPLHPHAALGYLGAHLRAAGHEAHLVDSSIQCYEELCRAEAVRAHVDGVLALESLDVQYPWLKAVSLSAEKRFAAVCSERMRLSETIELACDAMRSNGFYNFTRFLRAKHAIKFALHLAGTAHAGSVLSLTDYHCRHSFEDADDLMRAIEDMEQSVFFGPFQRRTVPDIVAAAPELVGVSFSVPYQLIPGLILCRLLKEHLSGVPIVVGGSTITRMREDLLRHPEFFELFDYAISGEGESSLCALAQSLATGGRIEAVPQLLWRGDGETHANDALPELVDPQLEPAPDYGDLFVSGKYFVPEPVAPLQATRTCYWNRCTFCDISYGAGSRHRSRTPSGVLRDMREIYERHGVRVFKFVDECLSPGFLRELSGCIVESRLPLLWECCVRYERQFKDPTLLAELRGAGCRCLYLGLESGSQRVIDAMNKGFSVQDASIIQRMVADAGILSHVFVMTGFPGETQEDFALTVDFLETHAESVHSVQISPFRLSKHSAILHQPGKFGFGRGSIRRRGSLSLVYDSTVDEHSEAIPIERARELWKMVSRTMPATFGVYRELLGPTKLLYAEHYGTNDLADLCGSPLALLPDPQDDLRMGMLGLRS